MLLHCCCYCHEEEGSFPSSSTVAATAGVTRDEHQETESVAQLEAANPREDIPSEVRSLQS
jgi:hypothetical protein